MAWLRSHKKGSGGGGGGDWIDIPIGALNADKYIKNSDGTEANYTGWSDTNYIYIGSYIDIYLSIHYSSRNIPDNQYCAYYDSSKTFISNFNLLDTHLTIPSNAKYIRLSAPTSDMQTLKLFGANA